MKASVWAFGLVTIIASSVAVTGCGKQGGSAPSVPTSPIGQQPDGSYVKAHAEIQISTGAPT